MHLSMTMTNMSLAPSLSPKRRRRRRNLCSWRKSPLPVFLLSLLSLPINNNHNVNTLISAFQALRSSPSSLTMNRVTISANIFMSSLSPSSSQQDSGSSSVRSVKNTSKENRNMKGGGSWKKKKKTTNSQKNDDDDNNDSPLSSTETWRIYGIQVHPDDLVASEPSSLSESSLYPPIPEAVKISLSKKCGLLDIPNGTIVRRRSLDTRLRARRPLRQKTTKKSSALPSVDEDADDEPTPATTSHYPVYNYIVDVPITKQQRMNLKWKHKPGQTEFLEKPQDILVTPQIGLSTTSAAHKIIKRAIEKNSHQRDQSKQQTRVAVVGMGPAGLFCALQLALFGNGRIKPILLDRGQPVERRGRDIGALIHRLSLNKESNFCFGEGGAGTWSDGKLTTRIGRNSQEVRWVLELLVEFGAPPEILWQGAPHLGTDNLVRLLRNMRQALFDLGGEIHFGTKMTDLEFDDSTGQVKAVLAEQEKESLNTSKERYVDDGDNKDIQKHRFEADAFVLATGHSARDVYESLHAAGVKLESKGFAVGFRVEHPQALINQIQLGQEWGPSVFTGKTPTDKANKEFFGLDSQHPSKIPPPSYRLATDQADDGTGSERHHRGVYSFCMCPGGQIVPASTEPDEVCVNGMSFSRRDSVWANSALVVSVAPDDDVLKDYAERYGVMAGIEFQRDMERRAARLGGGNFTVPVQRLTDFVDGKVSETIPTSSYRLGVKSAPCHEIYPEPITTALRDALQNHFAHQMPSYYSKDGLLHAVETRTSSPLRISRDPSTYKAVGTTNLYPAGEGAGFAGGIVSAAVDGLHVAEALLDVYVGDEREIVLEKSKSKGIGYSY